ncbi:hypothetical protein OIU92_00050 [Escherichia coli]|nr:hypothetical protein [Escherichia coli]
MQIAFFHLFGKDKKIACDTVGSIAQNTRQPAGISGPEAILMPGEAERTPA